MNVFSTAKIGILIGLLIFSPFTFSNTKPTSSSDNTNTETTSTTTETVNSNATSKKVASTPEEDKKITNSIKSLVNESQTLSKLNVKIETHHGVVTLDGTVDSNTQASELVLISESIIGVDRVDTSNLKIKDGKQPLADTLITAKIKGLFIREELFGEKNISSINTTVETKDGVVYLSGVVDNQGEIDNAIEIIKTNLPEVKKVEYHVHKAVPN